MWWGGREGELAEATRHRSRRSRRGTGAGIKTHRLAHKRSERSGRVEPILAAHVEHAEDDFFHREHAANTLARAQRPQRFFPVKNALIFLIIMAPSEQQNIYYKSPIHYPDLLRVDFYDVSEYDSYYEEGAGLFYLLNCTLTSYSVVVASSPSPEWHFKLPPFPVLFRVRVWTSPGGCGKPTISVFLIENDRDS